MKKYGQFIVVLGGFFLLVFLRSFKESDDDIPKTIGNENQQKLANPTVSPEPTSSGPVSQSIYKDGTYPGSVEDAFYGDLQVAAVIANGKLADVQFLQYPSDNRTSSSINEQALAILKSEAIQAQSAQVEGVSGASDSSPAFVRSLKTALQKAKKFMTRSTGSGS